MVRAIVCVRACMCVCAKEVDGNAGRKKDGEKEDQVSWGRGIERVRYRKERGREGENKVVWLPACACGSLTTVTHTNRNIPNKLRAFRVWQADIFSVRGTISYLRRKVEGLLDQIASHRDARGLA